MSLFLSYAIDVHHMKGEIKYATTFSVQIYV